VKFARRHCPRCARITRQEISCCVSASGAEHFGWWCLECHAWTPARNSGSWIAKETLVAHGVDLLSVPVVDVKKGPRCTHCGKRGAEEHHWAPRAIFGREVADAWPTDFLCKECHDEWHRKVTPQLVGGYHD
jgi:hypothetical protein